MRTLNEIREALMDRNLVQVSKGSGVHYNTVAAIASGRNTNPTYDILEKLNNYLDGVNK